MRTVMTNDEARLADLLIETCPEGLTGQAQHRRRSPGREARREEIAALWHEGFDADTIAARLGSTRNSITMEITCMRRDGWKMPYRRTGRADAVAA